MRASDLKVGDVICLPGKDDRTIQKVYKDKYYFYETSKEFIYNDLCDYLVGWKIKESKVKDVVKAPSHYANRKYQTILVMEDTMTTEEFKGYLKGNVMKYTSRAGKKDATLQELNKAKTYLQWLIEVEETGKLQNVPEYK